MYISRRNFVRIISFSVITITALTIYAVYSYNAQRTYARHITSNYQRGFAELSSYVSNIDTALKKGMYASTPTHFVSLSSTIWRDAGAATTSLENLPIYDSNLQRLTTFLSQSGEYSYNLARKVLTGGTVSEEDKNNLKKLSETASSLSSYLNNLQNEINDGSISIAEVKYTMFRQNKNAKNSDATAISNVVKLEEEIGEYPQLIYDGPFSDHIEKMEPLFIKDKKNITAQEAKNIAASFLGVDASKLKLTEEAGDKIPTFGFTDTGINISITKAGGYIYEMTDDRMVQTSKISVEEAFSNAKTALERYGFKNMKQSYYVIANNTLTINFAATQNNVILYPDLIKISVALDDGKITGLSANGYVMAHTENRDLKAEISEEQARAVVGKNLEIKSSQLAVIPTNGKHEKLCYEFTCRTQDDRTVLVYINAKNGLEEEILILIETEDGVLTT